MYRIFQLSIEYFNYLWNVLIIYSIFQLFEVYFNYPWNISMIYRICYLVAADSHFCASLWNSGNSIYFSKFLLVVLGMFALECKLVVLLNFSAKICKRTEQNRKNSWLLNLCFFLLFKFIFVVLVVSSFSWTNH